ncbi:MAG: hypothetical protein U0103_23100 [Candidatus Obscuribacterales bacterium]
MKTKNKKITTVDDGEKVYAANHLERVHARANAIVVARGNSTILASGDSFVRAYDSSTVIGTDRATIVVYSEDCNVELHDFAVIVDRVDENPIVSVAITNVVNLFKEGKP